MESESELAKRVAEGGLDFLTANRGSMKDFPKLFATLEMRDIKRLENWGVLLMKQGLFTQEDYATYQRLNNAIVETLDEEDKVSIRTTPDS